MRRPTERRHPDDGVLRRLLDEPGGVSDADRAHVAACPACLTGLARVRDDAAVAAAALAARAVREPDVDAAWARLSARASATERPAPASVPARAGRWRTALRSPVVAALGAVVVLTGAGVAAAADWLPIFRTERVVAVELAATDLVQVPDLSAYGDLEVTGDEGTEQVPDAATAEERAGLSLPEVGDLPPAASGDPGYLVADQVTATFTFRAERAAQAAAAAGEPLPPPPPGLDGSQVRLIAGPGVAQAWPGPGGVPALAVARLVAPTVESSGVPYGTVRDYLLSLPGLPEDLATQLRELSADEGSLPLPVPAEFATSSSTEVAGAPATLLTSRDGRFAAVVWVDDGVVTAVGGMLSGGEALAVARSLR